MAQCYPCGVTINVSGVFEEDGSMSFGLNYKDSLNRKVDVEYEGNDLADALETLFNAVASGVLEEEEVQGKTCDGCTCECSDCASEFEQGCDETAQMIVELQDKIRSLEVDNAALQKRVEALSNKRAEKTKHVDERISSMEMYDMLRRLLY